MSPDPRRYAFFAIVALGLNLNCAFACKGQTGKELWADNFQDVSTGWTNDERFQYTNNRYEIVAEPGEHGGFVITPPFGWDEGDLCVIFETPETPPEDGSQDEFCIKFLMRVLYGYSYCIYSTGESSLIRTTAGGDRTIFLFKDTPALNRGSRTTNELRVAIDKGFASFFVNDTKIKSSKVQLDDKTIAWGFGARRLGDPATDRRVWIVKSIRITNVRMEPGDLINKATNQEQN